MQSNVIFIFMFVAFVIFVTSRGELPAYFALFFGPVAKANTPSGEATPGSEKSADTPPTLKYPFLSSDHPLNKF